MTVAACCLSHSPVLGLHDPVPEVVAEVHSALDEAREFVKGFDPTLVVLFGVDHFNGFLYKVLPQFCIGTAAVSVGDYSTEPGPLDVPSEVAEECAAAALAAGVDVAVSAEMVVDHAFAQPLALLTGSLAAIPVIPVFINAAGRPRSPLPRSRALGRAVGEWAAARSDRVLLIGSGGLSHDPPVPSLAGAGPEVRNRLVHGLAPEAQRRREADTVALTRAFAAGQSELHPLVPEFDRRFMKMVEAGDLEPADAWDDQWLTDNFGRAVHEVRTWLATFSALAVAGPYECALSYYRPVPEWLVGFGLVAARSAADTPRS